MGFYHVYSPAEYFSAFSFCLDCCVWVALSAGWKFTVPLNCGVCSLWVGLDWWLVKVPWLGELVPVFWWVQLDLFSLECSEVYSSESWVFVCLAWLWAARLLIFRVLFLFCWRIIVVCLVLELVGTSVELGFSVGMENLE